MTGVAAARPETLWRDRDFQLFWSGQAVSLAGSAVTQVALPLVAVLILQASPLGVGVLQACVWLPFIGLPLLAGVHADRHRRRPILLATNAIRAVLLALVPALWALDALTLPVLCAIAVASGVCDVYFQIAEMAYVPSLVGRDRLLAANSAIEAGRSGAALGGRGLGGLLVQAVGAPLALLVDTLSYVVSVATLSAVRAAEAEPENRPDRHVGREIVEGIRFLWRSVPIRSISVFAMVVNGTAQAFQVSFVLYAMRDVGIGAGAWGLVLACSGVTALLGALLAKRLANGSGRTVVVTAGVASLVLLLVPGAGGPLWLVLTLWFVAYAILGLGMGIINPLVGTLRTNLTPDELLGRVGATARLLVYAGIPIGSLLGGVLASALGNRPTLWLTTVAAAASTVLLAPVWRIPLSSTGAAPPGPHSTLAPGPRPPDRGR